ncbi:MAG TPA: hypothetical protein VF881_02405 [Polyangiaceae bacterium]
MRPFLTGTLIATTFVLAAVGACKKEEPPPQNPQGWQQGQTGYGQPGPQGQPPPQQGYGQPAPTATTPPAATATGAMNPSPQGVPCSSDAQCLTHKCNVAAGKCSWPCQGPADCMPGMQCLAPICVPSAPGAAPAPTK